MKLQKIHLFLILLLALVFCSCLGTSTIEGYGNPRTYTGSEGNSATVYTGPQGGKAVVTDTNNTASATTYTGPEGGQATVVSGPQGQAVVATTDNTVNGVYYNDIPPGQEDLYILKSEVVPPVCPVCPSAASCPRQKPCPPCPPCARCPEPAFECKKVPNYASANDRYLPRPVLADFSQFGM